MPDERGAARGSRPPPVGPSNRPRPVIGSLGALLAHLGAGSRPTSGWTRVLFLDRGNGLIAEEAWPGDAAPAEPPTPQAVAARALDHLAAAVILVCHHPGQGAAAPSPTDIEASRRLGAALDPVGVVLHDYVIVAGGGHTSLRATGVIRRRS